MNSNLIFILIMLFLSALFSGIEISVAGVSAFHYHKKNKERIMFLLKNKENIISALLIGNNLSIIAATIALDGLLESDVTIYSRIAAFLLQILLFFFLAELLPKNIFRKLDAWALVKLYPVILIIYYTLRPFSWIFISFSRLIFRFIPETSRDIKKEDIMYFIRAQFVREKRPITQGLSALGKTRALEVMTPIPEVFSVNRNCTIKEALQKIKGTSYSRYPVFEDRGDNLIGHVNIFNLLEAKMTDKITKFLQKPVYIPENITADNILYKMQRENFPMMFVVNEYGSVTGIITLENIAEEIVGTDILAREQVTEKPYILKLSQNLYELDGNLDIDDLNQAFNLNIEKHGFETITGYIINLLGDIPITGTKIFTNFGSLLIKNANEKTILSIHLIMNKN